MYKYKHFLTFLPSSQSLQSQRFYGHVVLVCASASVHEAGDTAENQIEGTVFVDFIVAANGTVREVGVTDAPGEVVDQSFRAEAIRVVTAMPKWIPGRQRGKAVEVKFSLPITFQMI